MSFLGFRTPLYVPPPTSTPARYSSASLQDKSTQNTTNLGSSTPHQFTPLLGFAAIQVVPTPFSASIRSIPLQTRSFLGFNPLQFIPLRVKTPKSRLQIAAIHTPSLHISTSIQTTPGHCTSNRLSASIQFSSVQYTAGHISASPHLSSKQSTASDHVSSYQLSSRLQSIAVHHKSRLRFRPLRPRPYRSSTSAHLRTQLGYFPLRV